MRICSELSPIASTIHNHNQSTFHPLLPAGRMEWRGGAGHQSANQIVSFSYGFRFSFNKKSSLQKRVLKHLLTIRKWVDQS